MCVQNMKTSGHRSRILLLFCLDSRMCSRITFLSLKLLIKHILFMQIILACSGIFWTAEVSQAIMEKDGLKVQI